MSREGLLDEAARADALETLAAEASWWRPLSLLLRALGTALVLSGVIYFFAANWSGLGRFEKLGLAALLLASALALALIKGIDTAAGRLALAVNAGWGEPFLGEADSGPGVPFEVGPLAPVFRLGSDERGAGACAGWRFTGGLWLDSSAPFTPR